MNEINQVEAAKEHKEIRWTMKNAEKTDYRLLIKAYLVSNVEKELLLSTVIT